MIGRTISHYKITEKLGEGGMGVICIKLGLILGRYGHKILDQISTWLTNLMAFITGRFGDKKPWWWIDVT